MWSGTRDSLPEISEHAQAIARMMIGSLFNDPGAMTRSMFPGLLHVRRAQHARHAYFEKPYSLRWLFGDDDDAVPTTT